GLVQLNPDFTPVLDANGNPAPTYTQNDVQEFARAFTGWTYPLAPGATQASHNREYYGPPAAGGACPAGSCQMVAVESNHDTAAKTLLRGVALPAGQTANQDMNGALQNIFNDPTIGPFVVHN